MTFLLVAFFSGVLTVLAPCILPLLPVVIGSSASGRGRATPYIVVGSLATSIVVFTFVLKVSTAFITIPPETWTYLSGGILFIFGITLFFPGLWESLPGIGKLSVGSNKVLGSGFQKHNFWGDVIVGASLGPIFSTCSPTYFVILASVLPASFLLGTVYLLAYVIGLSLVLLLIAILGERFTQKLTGLSDPKGWFKRGIGLLFIVLGLMIIFGLEKKLETALLENNYFDITKVEQKLLESTEGKSETPDAAADTTVEPNSETGSKGESAAASGTSAQKQYKKYVELVNPSDFVNTGDQPIKISDYVGKKVILLDVMTYSCINCQRTFPYAVAWYDKYKDDGLIIIGIHTPEFAFEKDKHNVEKAMQQFGITFPIVLDNDYGTWNAYGNKYWPRKYLIDIDGNIVYDHIGEGAYDETEQKIRELLEERAMVLGEGEKVDMGSLAIDSVEKTTVEAGSPETYFGSARNLYLGNGTPGRSGTMDFTIPQIQKLNTLYLGGTWTLEPEFATAEEGSNLKYVYDSKAVYLVASAKDGATLELWQDGKKVSTATADVGSDGTVNIKDSRLYQLIDNSKAGIHTLEIKVIKGKVDFFTFTFG